MASCGSEFMIMKMVMFKRINPGNILKVNLLRRMNSLIDDGKIVNEIKQIKTVIYLNLNFPEGFLPDALAATHIDLLSSRINPTVLIVNAPTPKFIFFRETRKSCMLQVSSIKKSETSFLPGLGRRLVDSQL